MNMPRPPPLRDAATARARPRRTLAALSLALLCPAAGAYADDAPDVRRLMTPEEYQAAGLRKLDAEEIEALNRWLVRYTAKEAPVVRTSSTAVREEVRKVDAEVIRSRIVGEFQGWSGKTVFPLENGQVWRQRRGGSWHYRATNPEVEIRQNMLGFWDLHVLEADRAIGVKRVK